MPAIVLIERVSLKRSNNSLIDAGSAVQGPPEWIPAFILLPLAIGFGPTPIFPGACELTPEVLKCGHDVGRQESVDNVGGRYLIMGTEPRLANGQNVDVVLTISTVRI